MGKAEVKEEKKGWFPFIGKEKKEPEKQESEMKEKFKEGAKKAGEVAKKGGAWLGDKLKKGAKWTGEEMKATSIRLEKKNAEDKKKDLFFAIGRVMYVTLMDKHHGDVVDVDEDVIDMVYEIREWEKVIAECDAKLQHVHDN